MKTIRASRQVATGGQSPSATSIRQLEVLTMVARPRPIVETHTIKYVYGTDIIAHLAKDKPQAAWLTERLYNEKRNYSSGYIPAADFAQLLSNWLVEVRYPTSWNVIYEMTHHHSVFIG